MPTDVEYVKLYDTCVISADKLQAVNGIIDTKVLANKERYVDVRNLLLGLKQYSYPVRCYMHELVPSGARTDPFYNSYFTRTFQDSSLYSDSQGIPWFVIAMIHYLEAGFKFDRHLHNGDPLSSFTKQYPAKRPLVGHGPPFTFEESAVDALKLEKLNKIDYWYLPMILSKLEAYNGMGYPGRGINSPYLWSGSNHYTKGKFVADHKYDPNAVSQQLGAAVILKAMEQRKLINILRY